jgi:hypothetical protein
MVARFEVHRAVLLKIHVFWDVTPCLWKTVAHLLVDRISFTSNIN